MVRLDYPSGIVERDTLQLKSSNAGQGSFTVTDVAWNNFRENKIAALLQVDPFLC